MVHNTIIIIKLHHKAPTALEVLNDMRQSHEGKVGIAKEESNGGTYNSRTPSSSLFVGFQVPSPRDCI